ncbi:MAG TPA: bifunctional riboflavin kinase/FAD synthetase [Ignavibacteriaceae bacterium]|nr:bifunctional riboflavin kinase/FAD synthetase [Ignavibacteriaceae bacterium]
MEVFYDVAEVPYNKKTILTLGTFDGLHLGHQQILNKIISKAKDDGRSFLITFEPHPRTVLSKGFEARIITTLEEKIKVLEKIGIDNLLVINFTKEFSQISSEDFIKNYLVEKIGLSDIVIGYDHHFGKGRSGNKETLINLGKEYDFEVTQVDAENVNGETISSTKIRNAILDGDIKTANKFLGRDYTFSGVVVEGDKRGRTLGFPTANIDLHHKSKIVPKTGIYAVQIIVEGIKYNGVMSIGTRPTFYNFGNITIEVFIFDFDKEIYGESVEVFVVERLRDELKFNDVNKLIKQMNLDCQQAKEVLINI